MFESDLGARQVAWVVLLEQCESHGNEHATVFDTNKRYSRGILQFQDATFNYYGEKYGLPHDDIYSKDQQELIALYMLNQGLDNQWKNCTKKLGHYPTEETS